MPAPDLAILGWARSPVAPVGGLLRGLTPHGLGAPVVRALLKRTGVPAEAVGALVAGNALGAGGNPARMVALAAGLPDGTPALSLDSQCCAGLDAVITAAGLIAAGNAELVVAGGVEAWSRAPLRFHRPAGPEEAPEPYDRPPFAPDPARDPDLFEAAADLAARRGITRAAQEAWAVESHARALGMRAAMRAEIVPFDGLDHDPYARPLTPALLRRMPLVTGNGDTGLSRIAASPSADGAAFVLLATLNAARRLGVKPRALYRAGASSGGAPETPMLACLPACRRALERAGIGVGDLRAFELHEAFAVQALCVMQDLGLDPAIVSPSGGGLGRGHPIGASGAVSLVRLLADLDRDAPPGALGLATIAGAGGIGSAVVVERA
ncbi:thiolase family protein [Azospirillum sp. SYSU D00513]|uniref:acetyl-CoA C-acyltransferase n=1 Tax=Azospirillum sp. SYSU D00513 TaxID=2812561 RepID=UPI001A972A08